MIASKPAPAKGGRPSIFSPEIADTICESIAEGASLSAICRDPAMPSKSGVMKWLASGKHPDFVDQYARARVIQADHFFDEIIEIADDGSRDYKPGPDGYVVDHDHIARARLRVDARKWAAARLAPKKYGDRVVNEHSGPDGAAVNVTRIERVIIPAPEFITERIAELAARATGFDDNQSALAKVPQPRQILPGNDGCMGNFD